MKLERKGKSGVRARVAGSSLRLTLAKTSMYLPNLRLGDKLALLNNLLGKPRNIRISAYDARCTKTAAPQS
eukprot:4359633-Pleurochrysis_carterae.AAC.1